MADDEEPRVTLPSESKAIPKALQRAPGTLQNPTASRSPQPDAMEFPAPGEPGYSEDVRRDIANAIKPSERKMFLPSLWGWTIFGLVRLFVTVAVGSVIVFILTVLFESNVRHFYEAYGWDTLLTRTLAAMPEYLTHYTTWLIFGLIFGSAAAIWLVWAFPHRLGDHGEKSSSIKWSVAVTVVFIVCGAFYVAANQPSLEIATKAPPSGAEIEKTARINKTVAEEPITWQEQFQIIRIETTKGIQITGLYFQGISNMQIQMKEAYIASGMTGHTEQLKANIQYKGEFPVDQVDIPRGASVDLVFEWKPELSISDFLDQWGKFRFVAVYNGITHEKSYEENFVRGLIQNTIPGIIGPRMTPKRQ